MADGDDVLDVIDEFGFGDGLVNTDELDAVRMAAEVVALRSVVRLLFGRHEDDYARVWANRNCWVLDSAESAVARRAMEGPSDDDDERTGCGTCGGTQLVWSSSRVGGFDWCPDCSPEGIDRG